MSYPRTRNPVEIVRFFTQMMRDEGCITISPKQEEFRRVERDFLDGIRRVPADITAPPGTNPYSMALGKRGRWLFVWIPEDK